MHRTVGNSRLVSTRTAEGWVSIRRDKRRYYQVKRILDIVLSLLALIILLPFLPLLALLIRLDSPGPVIFSQRRMGFDWRTQQLRPFVMFKFRTMIHNCDQSIHREYIRRWVNGELRPSNGNGKKEMMKLTQDLRVTRVGRILRRASFDELPQLWNVLCGDMSLVGPRPVPLYEVAEYQAWHRQRLEATPGLTGLWQVKGRSLVTLDDMTRLDIQYIAQQSLWLDAKILLLTIPSVLSGRGAA